MRTLALLMSLGRAGFGLVLLVRPRTVSRGWLGEEAAAQPSSDLLARMVGARDVAVGVGGALAVARGQRSRGWVEAGVFSDIADTLVTAALGPRLPRTGVLMTLATTIPAAAMGIRVARDCDRSLDPDAASVPSVTST